MRYTKGIYFCHTPSVNPDEYYDCGHIITIDRIAQDCPVAKMFRAALIGTQEWNNCVETIRVEKDKGFDYISATLNDEVVEWLVENVKDSTDKLRQDMPQGWMIYDPYKVEEQGNVSVFFLRQSDAMAFKLRWG